MRLRSSQLKRVIATVFAFILLTSASAPGYSEEAGQETGSDAFPFEAGMSRVDITGPAVGIMFWGYAQEGQKGEGIHLRQYARSLVIKDTQSGRLLAYVTGELGGIPHEIHRDVVARLRKRWIRGSIWRTFYSTDRIHTADRQASSTILRTPSTRQSSFQNTITSSSTASCVRFATLI